MKVIRHNKLSSKDEGVMSNLSIDNLSGDTTITMNRG